MFLTWDLNHVRPKHHPLNHKEKKIQPLKQAGLFLQTEAILLLSILSGHGSVNTKQPICS